MALQPSPRPMPFGKPAIPAEPVAAIPAMETIIDPAPEPVQESVAREILGKIDIGFGLPENAWDAVPSAITSALADGPSWERRTALDRATPKARPGYVQRWVRIAMADGRADVSNKAEALMTGWRPRRSQTLADNEIGMPVYDPGDGKGGVMIFKEQLLLCEMPVEMHQRLEAAMRSEQDIINKTIYQEARSGNGMPAKYATLDYDSRDSAALMDR